MAQFDVFRLPAGDLVLDCQSDLLRGYNSRFVVPLLPLNGRPPTISRLNPVFAIEDGRFVMRTEFATTLPARDLRNWVTSLRSHFFEITAAIDYLVGGF